MVCDTNLHEGVACNLHKFKSLDFFHASYLTIVFSILIYLPLISYKLFIIFIFFLNQCKSEISVNKRGRLLFHLKVLLKMATKWGRVLY